MSNTEHGGIQIELAHIFPIIKKWLYSEKEIFLREITSNACDAVTKLRRLISLGEARGIDADDAKITVTLDKAAKTITVTDEGIGMTEEELRKYICQIALSGALDFIQKYEGEGDASQNGIIGHFGLGFYSAFMVSETVEVVTRSYTGAPAVHWSCNGDGEFDITPDYAVEDEIAAYGTAVIMHISEEGEEFLSEYKLKEVLEKYCAFMPVPIYFADAEKAEEEQEGQCDHEHGEGEECQCHNEDHECTCKAPEPVNDTTPLWLKNPADCTDDEYKEFYRKLFHDYKEPLFWIHLKADYPLNFKGILYFPRIANEYESLEGQVKLYYNQVFVADNIKEVIPEYLLMLKGVLDCPELPLNVSRSYLQNSGYVAKISAHITKKVGDKLNAMFNNDREAFEGLWRDLKTFVEYACMRDRKFYDRVKDTVLFEKCGGGFVTLNEYLETAKEKHENKVYYATDATAQTQYIQMFRREDIEVLLLDRVIDTQFITTVEMNGEKVKFARVDAETPDVLKDDGDNTEIPALKDLFAKVAGEHTAIAFDRFRDTATPAILNVSEESRRMQDMMKLYRMEGMQDFPAEATLVLNTASPLVGKLTVLCDEGRADLAEIIARQIFALSTMSQRTFTAEELTAFLSDSYSILDRLS
ncbi:MAG: molecular chaperone HtpG [Clostridia bacterium]|nr:molecular chaperone HtpG [Clostridia bacterium]